MKPSQAPVTLHVGRAGGTESLVVELREQVRARGVVKVRLLAAAGDRGDAEALCQDLARRSGAVLLEVRGHTAVFARAGAPKRAVFQETRRHD